MAAINFHSSYFCLILSQMFADNIHAHTHTLSKCDDSHQKKNGGTRKLEIKATKKETNERTKSVSRKSFVKETQLSKWSNKDVNMWILLQLVEHIGLKCAWSCETKVKLISFETLEGKKPHAWNVHFGRSNMFRAHLTIWRRQNIIRRRPCTMVYCLSHVMGSFRESSQNSMNFN